jgi:hypothetical protein
LRRRRDGARPLDQALQHAAAAPLADQLSIAASVINP